MRATSFTELRANGLIADDWARALTPTDEYLVQVGNFLRTELAAGETYLPAPQHILRAFERPMNDVRVVIVGQDPYPTPGHAIGLSFAVDANVRPLPRSLHNIYRELHDDLGIAPAPHGDLTRWTQQGVLLLNRALTVRPGTPASHRGKGWEAITECALRALATRGGPLVAILWGNDARQTRRFLGETPTIESAHPSPLSASRGFFGSRPFSRANALLTAAGATPIDWRVVTDSD